MRCLLLCSTRKAFRGNFYGSHGFIVGYSLERIITKLVELCVNNDILVRNKSDIQSAVLYSVLGILIANQVSQLIQGLELSGDTNAAMPQIRDLAIDTNANEKQAQAS